LAERLFVYGTLRPGRAPREIADAVSTLEPVGAGTVRGRMYDLGAYPGVVLGGDGSGEVHGEVFTVPDAAILARLDAYEDYRPLDPGRSLFLRVQTAVMLASGAREVCWIYVYNGAVSS